MKTKIVLWGENAQDEKLLLALELKTEENKVKIYTFPEHEATEEFVNLMMNEWRNNTTVKFPDEHEIFVRELTVSETLLPDDIKTDQSDVIQRAQTEWAFIVLSHKMKNAFESELTTLQDQVAELEKFDTGIWEQLKGFWGKVQAQMDEKNLFREHAAYLRDETNKLFSRLKELRKKMDEEFEKLSKENVKSFLSELEVIEEKINKGLGLQPIFEELKSLQGKFRDIKFTRQDRSAVWNRLDRAFKVVKEKRFGRSDGRGRSPLERLERRYDGLIKAIERMEHSITRDERDLEYENRKVQRSEGQLEEQIRHAKIKMIEERIRSKKEKLGEMNKTRSTLEKRMEVERERAAQREEAQKLQDAKKEAKAKIKEEMQEAAEARQEKDKKLQEAAEKISADKQSKGSQSEKKKTPRTTKKQKEASVLDALSATVGDSLEDVVDTVRAVATVVRGKIEEEIDELIHEEE
jgi:chromosome segregation ATPase